MCKEILVPLDGSERAEVILPHVEEIARRFKSEVHLLRVLEPVPATLGLSDLVAPLVPWAVDREYNDSCDYLKRVQARLHRAAITSHVHVRIGQVVPTIINFAEQQKVDLVAMASHGRSGVKRFYYGSVAAGVLHSVDRPLLVVRSSGQKERSGSVDETPA